MKGIYFYRRGVYKRKIMNVADLSKYDEIIIWGASMPPEETDVPTSHGRAIERLIEILRKK